MAFLHRPFARARIGAALILASFTPTSAADATGLGLTAAIDRTLLGSPELAVFSSELRAADARAVQARLRINPKLALVVEDVFGTGDFSGGRRAQTTLELAREIELGGKRAARIGAAERGIHHAAREYEVKRADVLARLMRRFVRAVAAQDLVDLAGRHVLTLEQGLEAARRRAAAGVAPVADETRASIALARGRLLEEDTHHELAAARVALATSWGDDSPMFDRVVGSLEKREKVIGWEELAARIDDSPEIARHASERALREAELAVALSRRTPNVGLYGGVRRLEEAGEQALVFGVEVPLALFDRNQGGILESQAAIDRVEAELVATEARLRSTLFALHQELVHSVHVLDAMEGEILPDADRALDAVRRGYEQGTLSSLDLLDAARTAVEVQRERVAVAESFHRIRIEISRLTGSVLAEAPKQELP